MVNDKGDGHSRSFSGRLAPCAPELLLGWLSCQANNYQERLDLSSQEIRPPSDAVDARKVWHQLLQVSSRTLRAIDAALDESERLMVSEFDVLITLYNAPNGRLRMTDLANATMLSSGGLTRLIGRLEQRGLVRRDVDLDDRRAFHASLTPAGHQKLARARAPHDAVIEQELGDRLTPRDLQFLETTLGKLLNNSYQ
jgi:DNA-binding MarR family transcriptional regulator